LKIKTALEAQKAHAERTRKAEEMRTLAATVEGRAMTADEAAQVRQLDSDIAERDAALTEYHASAAHQEHVRDNGDRSAELRDLIDRSANGRRVGGARTEERSEERTVGHWLATELRAVSTGADPGAAFSPTENSRTVLDFMAAQSVLMRSGVRVIRTNKESLTIPHLTSDAASAWVAEGGTISATDPTAESLVATPRKVAALTALSNEVIGDSDPAVLESVAKGLTRSLALRFDLGAFEGTGTAPQIRGLKNVSGIQTVSMGTNGAVPTNIDPIADAIGALEEENASAGAIVMHPRTWKTLIKLKEQTSGNNKPLLQESAGSGSQGVQRSIYGVPVFLSSQLAINETQGTGTAASSIYVYDPSEVIAVVRQDVRVDLDRSRLFNSDQSELRAISRADVLVPNPTAVVRITGVLA
jgi:HK97 family phage major capsid protein